MTGCTDLASEEGDRLAVLRSAGIGMRTAARELGRSPSTISRELGRNALPRGAYRSDHAEGACLMRRQRQAVLERDERLRSLVVQRLSEGWTPEQIAGRLKHVSERGLGRVSHETIYVFIYRAGQKAAKLWTFLVRHRARRRPMRRRASKDRIEGKVHISERSAAADARAELGHWEGDLVICKRSRPVLVLHERKTRITFMVRLMGMARLMGKTAGETVAAIQAVVRRLGPSTRVSITFDKPRQAASGSIPARTEAIRPRRGTEFAQHALLRGLPSATTYFCDAYASWQKCGIENANGRIRRWLPGKTNLDDITDADIQEIAMTLNLTPRKCLGYNTTVETFPTGLGKGVRIPFNTAVVLRT